MTSAFLAHVDRDEDIEREYGPGYEDEPRAKTLARIIEENLGVHEVRILGGGSFGIAAATAEEGGDVIKLTIDASEVETGTVLTNASPESYPANVVHLQGAWYVRKLRVLGDSWFDPKTEIWHYAKHRVGLLRMERVNPLDRFGDTDVRAGLREYVAYVKHEYGLWPHVIRKISRAKARDKFLHASIALERLLMFVWEERHEQVARDIARALGQLRALGIYAVDVHGANVGWLPSSPEAEIYKVFDIGMSSVGPGAPKPTEIGRKRTDAEAYEAPVLGRPVKVAELG